MKIDFLCDILWCLEIYAGLHGLSILEELMIKTLCCEFREGFIYRLGLIRWEFALNQQRNNLFFFLFEVFKLIFQVGDDILIEFGIMTYYWSLHPLDNLRVLHPDGSVLLRDE
jgi:hypothetical protein